jgi:DNA-binding transcriptional LysR family regulator
VLAGYGVTFISRTAVESDLAAGTLAEATLEGMNAKREISLVRASGRVQTRAAEEFVAFVRGRSAGVAPSDGSETSVE